METAKIERINELYRKSKAEGLTEEEKKEQQISVEQIVIGESTEEKNRKYRRITVHCEMNWHSFYILQFHVWR